MADSLAKTAIIYDFDGTLARGNLQECSFIPKMNMTREAFWQEVKRRTQQENADEILVYMHLMLEKAQEAGEVVTKEMLQEHGRKARLFPGLDGKRWFDRINRFAVQSGLELQHHIVSSGIEEMIRGCSMQDAFHKFTRPNTFTTERKLRGQVWQSITPPRHSTYSELTRESKIIGTEKHSMPTCHRGSGLSPSLE
jgi:phosphoserine phosphatase